MSWVTPTAVEQYMVELYNWARMNPTAAATKYGVSLNEGPTAYPISSDPKQPLAINPYITDAARTYARYLIDHDVFSHDADGRQVNQRMQAAGYPLNAPSLASENAGLSSVIGYGTEVNSVNLHFQSFFVDSTIGGRWHRLNMMNPDFKEVGSGAAAGIWQGFNAFVSVQNFGTSGYDTFLTGVAYTDASGDNFYTPGEQMGGVTVTAIRESDGALFATTTWSSGGYSMALPAGEYSIWGGGGGLNGWVRYDDVVIGSQNVKRDFRPNLVGTDPGPLNFAQVVGGQLNIQGTPNADAIEIEVLDRVYVTMNGSTKSFEISSVNRILISAGGGNDQIMTTNPGLQGVSIIGDDGDDWIWANTPAPLTISGGNGHDTIYGGSGHDQLQGGAGEDWIYGFNGYDYLRGDDGNDHLYGGSGYDNLLGGTGNDSLFGQSDGDTLNGGSGSDYLVGGTGSDTVDYSTRTANLVITLDNRYAAPNDGEAGELDTVLDDIESVLGGSGNDLIVGSDFQNFLNGGAGNDTIRGGGGFDLLFGGFGDDVLELGDSSWDYADGGAGNDHVIGDLTDVLLSTESFAVWAPPPPAPVRNIREPYRPPVV